MKDSSSFLFILISLFLTSSELFAQERSQLNRHYFEIENPNEEAPVFTRIENRTESGETVIWIFDLQNRIVSQSKIGVNPDGNFNQEITETFDSAHNLIRKTFLNLENSNYFTSYFEQGEVKAEVFFRGENTYEIWRQNPETVHKLDYDDFKPKADGEMLNNFLAKKLNYPVAALRSGAQGTAIVAVLVSEKGLPLAIELANGIQIHKDLGKEAVRVIKQFQGPYTPALNLEGNPTEAWLYIPIRFKRS